MPDLGIISPAMLKLFNDCGGKFYYRYVEQIISPTLDKAFVVGKNIHAMASYYLNGENISKFEKCLTEKEKEFWQYLKQCKYFDYDVVGVEKSLSACFGDFWLGGRLDAIVKQGDNIYILDYKTGGVSDDMIYDYQTMVYLLLCDRYFKKYGTLSFVYLDLKNKKDVVIKFDDSLRDEYKSILLDICQKMRDFDIKKFRRFDDCKCEYSKICI